MGQKDSFKADIQEGRLCPGPLPALGAPPPRPSWPVPRRGTTRRCGRGFPTRKPRTAERWFECTLCRRCRRTPGSGASRCASRTWPSSQRRLCARRRVLRSFPSAPPKPPASFSATPRLCRAFRRSSSPGAPPRCWWRHRWCQQRGPPPDRQIAQLGPKGLAARERCERLAHAPGHAHGRRHRHHNHNHGHTSTSTSSPAPEEAPEARQSTGPGKGGGRQGINAEHAGCRRC